MTRAPDQAFLEFVKSRAAPLHRVILADIAAGKS